LGRNSFDDDFREVQGGTMSERRQVWETLSHLLQRVDNSIANAPPAASDSSNLEQEIRNIGKTQHKANLLSEEQNALAKQTLAIAQSARSKTFVCLKPYALNELPPLRKIPSKPFCLRWTAWNTLSSVGGAICKSVTGLPKPPICPAAGHPGLAG